MLYPPTNFPSVQTNVTIVRFFCIVFVLCLARLPRGMQIAHANTARSVPEFVCINAIAQLRIALDERHPLTQFQLTCRLNLTSSWLKAAGPPTPALHIPT